MLRLVPIGGKRNRLLKNERKLRTRWLAEQARLIRRGER